jgi:two-component system, cell cycle sensor histidine kinase and response regulator CckA
VHTATTGELERLVAELREENERVNDALRASESRFRALMEHAVDITAIVDADSVLLYVSPSVERILGYEPAELVGTTSLDFVHPDDVGLVGEIFARATVAPGIMQTEEFRARHKDGTWRQLEAIGINLLDDPAIGGMVVTARDVTSRRALESRLVQAERLEAIGQLAGGVAHDFNNVLLVIRGYSSVLRSSLNDRQQIADVDEIANAADRAAELTRQLLAFGRRQVLQPRLLSLVEVVRGMQSLLQRSLREDIGFDLELPGSVPPVTADPAQMEQVLLNLVVNARDAIVGPGVVRVAIETARIEGDEVGIAPPLPPGDYVALAVADTGTGIDEMVLPHIFEPFFTTKEDGVGTGLGLSTVYGIVAQSGGGVEVRSLVGGGTSFVVYLPVAAGPIPEDAPEETVLAPLPSGHETILVVEDEEPVRLLVRRVLEAAGYIVLGAAKPSEAERLLAENDEIDLMLSDVVMPEMSGYDLAARVRAERPEMKLLFMSGYSHRMSGSDAVDAELLKKPFAPEQLARAVRQALDDRGNREIA